MLELQKEEVHGIETLEKITKLLYGNIDTSEVFSQNNSFYIDKMGLIFLLFLFLLQSKMKFLSRKKKEI